MVNTRFHVEEVTELFKLIFANAGELTAVLDEIDGQAEHDGQMDMVG